MTILGATGWTSTAASFFLPRFNIISDPNNFILISLFQLKIFILFLLFSFLFLSQSFPGHLTAETQKQIDMQRLQTEHLKRQQEHIMQHNIQELQAQISKGQVTMPGPQSLMFLPFLQEQLRGLPVPSMPPPTSTATTGNKHINSIANVSNKLGSRPLYP